MAALRILEGSNFCICDERGDIGDETSGLFAHDTRFLSLLRLTVNGKRPLLLTSSKVEYFSAAFYLRNPLAKDLRQDEVLIARERFVGEGMQDRLLVQNQGQRKVQLDLTVELGSDFADIFTVKARDFALGDPLNAPPLPPLAECRYEPDGNQFVLVDSDGATCTQVILSRPGSVDGASVTYRIELAPRERWEARLDVVACPDGVPVVPHVVERRFGAEREHVRNSLTAWQLRVPQLRASWDELSHSFSQSVADLASLRLRSSENEALGNLPGAGIPWFMTVFGRDTIITCLQTLLFGPELARSALEVLAELQATEDDPTIDAEPGKIVHEVRHGKAAKVWHRAYYGTADATPLYLVLLSEVWRWTDDAAFVRGLRDPALRALEWIDRYGDRDGDGFVEYLRRADPGIRNQSWKDSDDSMRFADGTIAEPPIAPVEVQGYVYDAKRRMAELAREVWRDRGLADRLEAEAERLREQFNVAFWDEERGRYVLGLDRDKRRIDSLCSNVGHLLWSGIVVPERVDTVVDQLMGEGLWSGWGVRTMASTEGGYNPLSYHNGTVWPHDNSLIAAGLARHSRWPEAQRIVRRMLEAAAHFEYQLPEVFAGFPRADTPFPIAYPTAARPQAWAAGAPVILLQALLGLQPDRRRQTLETVAPLELPSWVGRLRLAGVRAFGRAWDVRLDDGGVVVEEA
jgi:glycogen debranching enzyme